MKPPPIFSTPTNERRRHSQGRLHATLVALLRGVEAGTRVEDIPDTPLDEFAQRIERLIDAAGGETLA